MNVRRTPIKRSSHARSTIVLPGGNTVHCAGNSFNVRWRCLDCGVWKPLRCATEAQAVQAASIARLCKDCGQGRS